MINSENNEKENQYIELGVLTDLGWDYFDCSNCFYKEGNCFDFDLFYEFISSGNAGQYSEVSTEILQNSEIQSEIKSVSDYVDKNGGEFTGDVDLSLLIRAAELSVKNESVCEDDLVEILNNIYINSDSLINTGELGSFEGVNKAINSLVDVIINKLIEFEIDIEDEDSMISIYGSSISFNKPCLLLKILNYINDQSTGVKSAQNGLIEHALLSKHSDIKNVLLTYGYEPVSIENKTISINPARM